MTEKNSVFIYNDIQREIKAIKTWLDLKCVVILYKGYIIYYMIYYSLYIVDIHQYYQKTVLNDWMI